MVFGNNPIGKAEEALINLVEIGFGGGESVGPADEDARPTHVFRRSQ